MLDVFILNKIQAYLLVISILLGFIRSESEERAKGIQSTLYQRSYHLSVSSLYI